MENLEIIPVTPAEAGFLASLAEPIWREHFTPIIGMEQVSYMLKKFQSKEALSAQMAKGFHYYFFKYGGKIAGYTGIKKDGSSLFLSKLYLKKEYRGKKIAKAGIDFMKGLCSNEKLGKIWLTVNRHNDTAIAAYKAMGFKILRKKLQNIGGGFFMDDYIMELDLS